VDRYIVVVVLCSSFFLIVMKLLISTSSHGWVVQTCAYGRVGCRYGELVWGD
jgi:hypothetical protein